MHLKLGNPEVFHLSKATLRNRYGIGLHQKVLSIYTTQSGIQEIPSLLKAFPNTPDVVFISISNSFPANSIWTLLEGRVDRSFEFIELSEMSAANSRDSSGSSFRLDVKRTRIVYNDSKGRMPELYAASDYAIVIGANNFFEPLMIKVPTLIVDGKYFNYNSAAWTKLKNTALATGGAVSIPRAAPDRGGVKALLKIDASKIEHPAFVIPTGENKTGLHSLLDQIEFLVREQVGLRK